MKQNEARGLLLSAKERIQQIRRFYTHLASFIGIHGLLFYVAPDPAVPFLTLLPWGGGLLYHGLQVFGWKGKKTLQWEKDFVHQLMGDDAIAEFEQSGLHSLTEKEVLALKRRLEVLETIVVNDEEALIELEGSEIKEDAGKKERLKLTS